MLHVQNLLWAWGEIEKRSEGRVEIINYWSETLAKHRECADAVTTGTVDIGYVCTTYHPAKFPICESVTSTLSIFNVGVKDTKWTRASFQNFYVANKATVDAEMANQNMKWLFVSAGSAPNVIISVEPIHSLADMEGVKIRTNKAGVTHLWQVSNAIPVSVSSSEAYEAMARGAMDANIYSMTNVVARKQYEVAKYIWPIYMHGYSTCPEMINLDVWNALPEDIKAIFEDVGEEFIEYSGRDTDRVEKESREFIESQGVTIFPDITKEEAEEWMEMAGTQWFIDHAAEVGVPTELYSEVLDWILTETAKRR